MKELGAKLEKILNKIVEELKQDGVELSYNVNAYASRRGLNATIQLSLRPEETKIQSIKKISIPPKPRPPDVRVLKEGEVRSKVKNNA